MIVLPDAALAILRKWTGRNVMLISMDYPDPTNAHVVQVSKELEAPPWIRLSVQSRDVKLLFTPTTQFSGDEARICIQGTRAHEKAELILTEQ